MSILRFGWELLGTKPGRLIVQRVCTLMVRKLERRNGPAILVSRRQVVRLWRLDSFAAFASEESPWLLDDGTIVRPDDPVLEMHIAGDRLLAILLAGERWQDVLQQEFASLAPALQRRDEVALVGRTILRNQVARFGASLRDLPPGLSTAFETFYRKLILLAFHPRGSRRAMSERQQMADAAISRCEFCRRYGEAARQPAAISAMLPEARPRHCRSDGKNNRDAV
ncbi:MAG TPA: hypothetical protein VH678_05995 [Xanthobacteraceae bacterium]